MTKHVFYTLILICLKGFSQENWSKNLPNIGTMSSPRVADLNKDGVLDIVLGAGKNEFLKSDSAIIALDGKNGNLLWKNSARDQMFISAGFVDIDKDGTKDVIIGGRSSEFMALNGTNGKVIWKFDTLKYSENKTKRWFNFYNPQIIDDQDKDGVEDILVSNGGDIWVKPHDPNRATVRIVVISSKTGRLLAEAMMPDGKEIYMSVSALKKGDDYRIIFGTGGETVGGNLFIGNLKSVLKGDLSSAIKIASSPNKGFISPPVWVEITGDNEPDIVVNSVDGRIMAFDGYSLKPIWEKKFEGTEAYSSSAVGYFNDDEIPDFFVSYAQGVWPKLEWTKQFMVNGKNGNIEFADSLGYYQTSSPVVVDVNNDGRDEAILSVNYQVLDSLGFKTFHNTLMVVEFGNKEVVQLIDGLDGHNISSTPYIGDIDNNQMLDIIFVSSDNKKHTYVFDGMQVSCLKTTIPIKKTIKWGGYMGTDGTGVFKK